MFRINGINHSNTSYDLGNKDKNKGNNKLKEEKKSAPSFKDILEAKKNEDGYQKR